jgi:hypothetical protein
MRIMNIEQGISNHEVGSRRSSLLNWTFYIRYSAVRFSSSAQIAGKLHTKDLTRRSAARSDLAEELMPIEDYRELVICLNEHKGG